MKILIRTNPQGKTEIVNNDTGQKLDNIGRVDIYVNCYGKASAVITFKDVELDIEVEKWDSK